HDALISSWSMCAGSVDTSVSAPAQRPVTTASIAHALIDDVNSSTHKHSRTRHARDSFPSPYSFFGGTRRTTTRLERSPAARVWRQRHSRAMQSGTRQLSEKRAPHPQSPTSAGHQAECETSTASRGRSCRYTLARVGARCSVLPFAATAPDLVL